MTVSAPPLPVLAEQIPEALRRGKRFVAWRFEARRGQPKPTKVPYSPDAPKGASSTDPSHWTTFDTAVKYARVAGLDGIGRVFDHADGLVGPDLDNCLDPSIPEPTVDDLAPWAAEIVKRVDTYTEVSPSGTGVKLWAYGSLPPSGRKKGDIEMYGSVAGQTGPCGRYFTMTGRHLKGTPADVGYRPDAILAVHRDVFGTGQPLPIAAAPDDPDRPIPALELGDDDVIRLASESPHNGPRFRRLWDGDTSDYARDGNDGASEADCALVELLAFYGGPDSARIDRLYRRSGLAREKWDRADYRERTIRKALDGKTRFYGDGIRPTPASGSDGASGCACPACPARARVRHLERALLDRDDLVEHQQTIIRETRTERDRLAERLAGWKTILSNPKLKPADRIVAIPVIEQVRNARQLGQGEIHIRYPGIVNGWGIPESTVQKSVAVLTEREGARLGKRSQTVREAWGPNMRTYVWAIDGQADLYAAIGAYDPQLPKNGGRRLPSCDTHPEADVVYRTVPLCADCRKPIGPAREHRLCRQSDGIGADGTETVSVGNPGRQTDAIGGDELAARRARATAAVPVVREVDRWKRIAPPAPEQPALLEVVEAAPAALVVDEPQWLRERPPDPWLDDSPTVRAIMGASE